MAAFRHIPLENVQTVVNALQKQVPMKPTFTGDGYADGSIVYDTWTGPNCGKNYEVEYDEYEYCPECGCKRMSGKVEIKEIISLLKGIQSPSQDYAIEQAISALEKGERYKWHDLKNNPNDLPEISIDYEVENGKFSDNVLVKTDYDTLMVAKYRRMV